MYFFLLAIAVIGFIVQCIIENVLDDDIHLGKIVTGVVSGVLVIILIVGGLTSWYLFKADDYHTMIEIEEGNFEKDINPIENTDNISIVDVSTARKLGDRTVGSIKNSSWYEVDDEYNLIKYQGQQYRISALNYGKGFKFHDAKHEGIPGYVLVNTQTQEAKYIELEEGMKYSPSAYWSSNLTRHLRNEYSSYIFGKSFFEIDEDGVPYYITSVKKPTIGMFGGKKEEFFIITNAITGENKEYTTDELPQWVDHAYDLSYLMEVTKNYLTYADGFWNGIFVKTGVLKTSYQYSSSYYNTTLTSDGQIVFYTGLTPASDAESNVGFILANPRNGKIKRYNFSGAEETSAQDNAEAIEQEKGYNATFPSMLNVDGKPTYFMLLKDKAGLVQTYALCDLEDYTKIAVSATLEETLQLYRKKLGTLITTEAEQETQSTEGTIENLYQAQLDGCTFYYFTIEGSTDLYMSSIKNSNKQVMLKEGTKVSIEYSKTSEEGVYKVQKIQF